ncbi:MAG: hypothetical protein ACOY31_12825 [Bacillota bacterium]
MINLTKTIFAVPPQVRQKLLNGEYERVGGVIREKLSGNVVFHLVDKLEEEKDGASISVSMPEIMDSTLRYLTAGQIKKHLELLENELDALNIQIKPDDRELIVNAIDHIHLDSIPAAELQSVTGSMYRLYARYQEIFSKYLKDLDRPKSLHSFPFLKILILITVITSKICIQSRGFNEAAEWVRKTYENIIDAMKSYCLLNSKTDKDLAHFSRIAKLPSSDFLDELKEVLAGPATKPKYKFPPMEVIYLWNCSEYLEGYLLELERAI